MHTHFILLFILLFMLLVFLLVLLQFLPDLLVVSLSELGFVVLQQEDTTAGAQANTET